jgi:hypothetical protein
LVLLKVGMAILVAWRGWRNDTSEVAFTDVFVASPCLITGSPTSVWRGVLSDLLRPLLLGSLALMGVFFYFSESASGASWVWRLLRPLAIAIVFFYLARSPWLQGFGKFLRRFRSLHRFADLFEQTVQRLSRANEE